MDLDDLPRMDGQDLLNRLRMDHLAMEQLAMQTLVVELLEIIRLLSESQLGTLDSILFSIVSRLWPTRESQWEFVLSIHSRWWLWDRIGASPELPN